MSRDLGPTVLDAFGPVGARFAQAFADAADALISNVATIGDKRRDARDRDLGGGRAALAVALGQVVVDRDDGRGWRSAAVSPDGTHAYVATESGSLTVISLVPPTV